MPFPAVKIPARRGTRATIDRNVRHWHAVRAKRTPIAPPVFTNRIRGL